MQSMSTLSDEIVFVSSQFQEVLAARAAANPFVCLYGPFTCLVLGQSQCNQLIAIILSICHYTNSAQILRQHPLLQSTSKQRQAQPRHLNGNP